MFVIAIKKIFDYDGTKLNKPEYEYFGYDKYAGSFSTGYPTWMRFRQAEIFKTAEEAKEVYLKTLHYLICSWKECDRDSIKICEIKFEPMETILKYKEDLSCKVDED